ncbi:MAG: deoxyribodipyrimidine photo-lyase [Bacteroidetes bacterium]|nr:deoxyribodipyrimidine photo-lyase [Bacteroidota bacterium]
MEKFTIFWFRRDLRINDNKGFFEALNGRNKVIPIFIYDTEIIDKLHKDDHRLTFIQNALGGINNAMKRNRCALGTYRGTPEAVFEKIIREFPIEKVVANHDYEPYAMERDERVKKLLKAKDIDFETFKDQVIFERNEVVKDDGNPYMVYTPYSRKWLAKFHQEEIEHYPSENHLGNLYNEQPLPHVSHKEMGFETSEMIPKDFRFDDELIDQYEATRNFPADDATSRLGVHLRFGTQSVRKLISKSASRENTTFLKELIWREFFMQILWHFPHTVNQCFKKQYDRIEYRNNEEEFEKWCQGKTGYPLVDAGMRELNRTGFMHNRVRMLTASFLCKHLLIDWRWGEAYFAEKLFDYEMSSNIGNWQWSAGCGVDAAPYFRIFNPHEQIKKFDKGLEYIKKWIEDLDQPSYPEPIVAHKFARERCLMEYKLALNT